MMNFKKPCRGGRKRNRQKKKNPTPNLKVDAPIKKRPRQKTKTKGKRVTRGVTQLVDEEKSLQTHSKKVVTEGWPGTPIQAWVSNSPYKRDWGPLRRQSSFFPPKLQEEDSIIAGTMKIYTLPKKKPRKEPKKKRSEPPQKGNNCYQNLQSCTSTSLPSYSQQMKTTQKHETGPPQVHHKPDWLAKKGYLKGKKKKLTR